LGQRRYLWLYSIQSKKLIQCGDSGSIIFFLRRPTYSSEGCDSAQENTPPRTDLSISGIFPHSIGSLKSFEKLPLLPPMNEIPCVPPAIFPSENKELQSAFKNLAAAGEETIKWRNAVRHICGGFLP